MKRVLYLVRRPPGALADETTDLMLVSGVFEQPATVLFLDDGVYQLYGLRDRRSSIKALPTYGVDDLRVAAESLDQRGLSLDDVDLDVRAADQMAVGRLIADHDIVLSD